MQVPIKNKNGPHDDD